MAGGKVLSRIKKLQKLAENNENEHEAEIAAEQALRLMREHAVSQADVDAAELEQTDPMVAMNVYLQGLKLVPREERTEYNAKTAGWKRALVVAVGGYLCCYTAYVPGTGHCSLYGRKSDCEAVVELYAICARQIDRLCREWLVGEAERYKALHGMFSWGKGEGKTAAVQFKDSAVQGLKTKFDDLMREDAQAHATGNALVVSRKQAATSWAETNYSFSKTSASDSSFGGNAGFSSAGYKAGRDVNLHADPSVAGSDRRRLDVTR